MRSREQGQKRRDADSAIGCGSRQVLNQFGYVFFFFFLTTGSILVMC